jgi:hypothetical protein
VKLDSIQRRDISNLELEMTKDFNSIKRLSESIQRAKAIHDGLVKGAERSPKLCGLAEVAQMLREKQPGE